MNKLTALLAAAAVIALAQPAAAAVINTLPGGTAQVMPDLGYAAFTAGPVTFGDITYTSTNSNSVIGWSYGYGFAGNGFWSGNPMAGVNTTNGTMTFTFAAPVSAVLADINWAPGYGEAYMSIFDSADTLLETFSFNSATPGYWGFQRGQGDIAKLTLSNGYVGAQNFSTLSAAVPEPATWALMIGGFGLAGLSLRSRRPVAA